MIRKEQAKSKMTLMYIIFWTLKQHEFIKVKIFVRVKTAFLLTDAIISWAWRLFLSKDWKV